MLIKLALMLHLLGFLVLILGVITRFIVVRRLGTPKEKLPGTARLRSFNKAPQALAFLLIIISGSIMTAALWNFTDAWILGGLLGFPAIDAVTIISVGRLLRKANKIAVEVTQAWGRLMALLYIAVCMVVKPDWHSIFWIFAVTAIASVVLASAATSKRRPALRVSLSAAVLLILLSSVFAWRLDASKLPQSFSIMQGMAHHHTAMVSVDQLTESPGDQPVRNITLTAEEKEVTVAGKLTKAWTYNGTSPGPTLRARVGERLRVTLVNQLPAPTSIHWHGVVLPNSQDGVAGVTQDAVQPGKQFVYEFVAHQPGTYWYHPHQDPAHQVDKGLFGALIIDPATPTDEQQIVAVAHTWGDTLTVNGQTSPTPIEVAPGKRVRLRLINGDSKVLPLTTGGAPFVVSAFDAGAVNEPSTLHDIRYDLAGAGRLDMSAALSAGQELDVALGGSRQVTLRLVTAGSKTTDLSRVTAFLNPLHYGLAKGTTPLPQPDGQWRLNIDGAPGFYNGRFGWFYTINGKRFPNGPMLMVEEGKTYDVTFVNRSRADHPMHLHGHTFQVLSIDDDIASGSPMIVDNVNVAPHQTVTIRFTANNKGIWMAHCHNLIHAYDGMDLMVGYKDVTTPYLVGGSMGNIPE